MTAVPDKPAIVLLHGSADSPQSWQPVAALLGAQFTVSALPLPPIATPLALDTDLPWLTQLMAHTGARVLAGHSYGALLALRWALDNPGRLDRLVLGEPIAWGIASDVAGFATQMDALLTQCLAQFAAGRAEVAMHWLVDYWNKPGFWQALPEKIRVNLTAAAARTAAEVASGAADRTAASEVARMAVPTVLVAGAASTRESKIVAERLASAIPGATLLLLEGAGHQFLRSHAGQVAQACTGE